MNKDAFLEVIDNIDSEPDSYDQSSYGLDDVNMVSNYPYNSSAFESYIYQEYDEEEWEEDGYPEDNYPTKRNLNPMNPWSCGSPACIAGHAAYNDIRRNPKKYEEIRGFMRWEDGNFLVHDVANLDIHEIGRQALGLNQDQAYSLFKSGWPISWKEDMEHGRPLGLYGFGGTYWPDANDAIEVLKHVIEYGIETEENGE